MIHWYGLYFALLVALVSLPCMLAMRSRAVELHRELLDPPPATGSGKSVKDWSAEHQALEQLAPTTITMASLLDLIPVLAPIITALLNAG